MSGSITLPQVVLDLEEEDRKAFEALKPPASMVVRYGYMKFVAELPYDGKDKVGCGSKLVIRTDRGAELAEMLTTTCGNSGCGKSVSRQEMLDYIENSGGKNYPFTTNGRILHPASVDDLLHQQKLDGRKREMLNFAKDVVAELNLAMKLVDVEPLLGGERIIFHYTSQDWVDFRELVKRLASQYHTRIDMHQVSERDEARIVADYEKCGQHCCCKQFLKVLKNVSMRMAKVQKATMDPSKISGRCGRLMCCLRYEDETYDSLKKNLPFKQTRMMTPEDGAGTVVDTQILTQLALVLLDSTHKTAAYPIEALVKIQKGEPGFTPPPPPDYFAGRSGSSRGPRPSVGLGTSVTPSAPSEPRGEREDRGGQGEREDRGDRGGQGEREDRGERGGAIQPQFRPRPGRPDRGANDAGDFQPPISKRPATSPTAQTPPPPTGSRGYGNRIINVTKPPASTPPPRPPTPPVPPPSSATPLDDEEDHFLPSQGSVDDGQDVESPDDNSVEDGGNATDGQNQSESQGQGQGGRRRNRRGRGKRRRGGGRS